MNTASLDTAPKDLSGIKRGPIVAALIIGAFVAILNETLLNIAFPDLMKEFDISYATIQWLSTAYMLVVGILVPITALLQQWFTTRQMFLSAMILFLVGTIVCGTATVFPALLVGRVIQALGTGLMLPVMMNTILVIFPPEKRGGAMGMIGLVIMSAPAIGPTLSGLIIESFNWRWLFYFVIPLAIFSIMFAAVYLKNVSDITRPKVDLLSILLSSLGFGGLIYGFSKAGEDGWGSSIVIWSIVVGAIALLLFIVKQLMSSQPLLDLNAFKYPMFSLVALLMLVMMMTLFSTMILLPLFLQNALGKTALAAGLILLPGRHYQRLDGSRFRCAVRQVWTTGTRHSGACYNGGSGLDVYWHRRADKYRLYYLYPYRAVNRCFYGDDAGADDGAQSAAPPAVSAWHSDYEHAAAGCRSYRHRLIYQHYVIRLKKIFRKLC